MSDKNGADKAPLKIFIINRKEIHNARVEIAAASQDEALRAAERGEGKISDFVFSHVVDAEILGSHREIK